MTCARCSTPCAGSCVRGRPGGCCPPTSSPGQRSTSSPESGQRAGYDGHKKRRGSKVHLAVDTLGHLLALTVTPANEDEREQAGDLAEAAQEATAYHLNKAYVDQ